MKQRTLLDCTDQIKRPIPEDFEAPPYGCITCAMNGETFMLGEKMKTRCKMGGSIRDTRSSCGGWLNPDPSKRDPVRPKDPGSIVVKSSLRRDERDHMGD